MSKMPLSEQVSEQDQAADDLLPEYRLDYSRARPNRFADPTRSVVALDPDVAAVFTSQEAVNRVLRALIQTMPPAENAQTS